MGVGVDLRDGGEVRTRGVPQVLGEERRHLPALARPCRALRGAGAPGERLEYIKKYLGAPQGVDIEELREESAEHLRVNQDLKAQVDALKTKLENIENQE